MEYQKELKRLEESGKYWKPKVGQYKVKALTELEETDPFVKKREGQENEVHAQAKIKILVDEEEKLWTFGIGTTLASTFGQLVNLATKHGDKLTDVEFSVVVKSDGNKKDYTIVQ